MTYESSAPHLPLPHVSEGTCPVSFPKLPPTWISLLSPGTHGLFTEQTFIESVPCKVLWEDTKIKTIPGPFLLEA